MKINYKELILENPHILNFQDTESNIQIPKWFIPQKKRLWSGDADAPMYHFKIAIELGYNVYYCYPDSMSKGYEDLFYNLIYLKKTYGEGSHLICLIDIKNKDQIDRFSTVFTNYFDEFKRTGHNWSLEFDTINKILKLNGKYYFDQNFTITYTTIDLINRRLNNIDNQTDQLQFKLIIESKSISKNIDEVLTENVKIYEDWIASIKSKLNVLVNNNVLSKFFINAEESKLKSSIENFNTLSDFIESKYRNKFQLFEILYNIYIFLRQNFYVPLPKTLFGLVDIVNDEVIFYYQKRDNIKLELFYRQKYLKYKKKYLSLKYY
uniref:Uncharacterized protein n=1 Tax=viral metagenome TaxID=1070528 RepID=A0A6C0H0U5_9ZZZZ